MSSLVIIQPLCTPHAAQGLLLNSALALFSRLALVALFIFKLIAGQKPRRALIRRIGDAHAHPRLGFLAALLFVGLADVVGVDVAAGGLSSGVAEDGVPSCWEEEDRAGLEVARAVAGAVRGRRAYRRGRGGRGRRAAPQSALHDKERDRKYLLPSFMDGCE